MDNLPQSAHHESYPQTSLSDVPTGYFCGKSGVFPLARGGGLRLAPFIPAFQQVAQDSVENRKNFFHLHLISDSTGETLISAGRAAAVQFSHCSPIEHVYPLIRNKRQMSAVLEAIDREPGIVLYTMVDQELAALIDEGCSSLGVPSVNVLEPVIGTFQTYLGPLSRRRVGAQYRMNADYFARIEALNYAMDHDDGQMQEDYEQADVVLVGISRTSKTPTSIYLANRGIKAANIPIVPGAPLPQALLNAKKPLIIGLIATSDRISQVRGHRELGHVQGFDPGDYTDRASIVEELKYARMLCARHNWPIIDVTRRSIEETAAAIIALRQKLV